MLAVKAGGSWLKGGMAALKGVGGAIGTKAKQIVTFGQKAQAGQAFVSGTAPTIIPQVPATAVAAANAVGLFGLAGIGGSAPQPAPTEPAPTEPSTTPDPEQDTGGSGTQSKPTKGRLGQTLGKIGEITSHPLVAAGIMGVGQGLADHAARKADNDFWKQRMQWLRDSNAGLAEVMGPAKPWTSSTQDQLESIDRRTQSRIESTRPTAPTNTRPTSFLGEAARKYVSGRALLPHAINS